MKACVIQPPYSRDLSFSGEYFDYKINQLDLCDESMDIIVLPEYSDVLCATTNREETLYYHNMYTHEALEIIVEKINSSGGNAELVLMEGYNHSIWEETFSNHDTYRWLLQFSKQKM